MTMELATQASDGQATSHEPGAPSTLRRQLPCTLTPTQVLARLRGRRRLAGLIGAWAGGGAIIACDPVARATTLSALTSSAIDSGEIIGAAWIGVLGYQYGAHLETLPAPPDRPLPRPDCDFAYYDHLLRYEAHRGVWWFESCSTPTQSERIEVAYRQLARQLGGAEHPTSRSYTCGAFAMRPSADGHRRAIRSALESISVGDIFQANVTVRLEAEFHGDPLDVFIRGVQDLRPAYAAYVCTDDGAVASLSPELFLRRTGRTVETSPIKGTAPLSTRPQDLLASSKDHAENTMIVDLMRNDLGRVSLAGSVTVPGPTRVEEHTGVWHLLTDVKSMLRDEVTDVDLLEATFPPGSVTGAPKVRAMELINELEDTAREAYTGAIGVVAGALLEFNVAIRTFEFVGDSVWLGVGGGIVADSTPDGELSECLAKAQPLLRAIGATFDDAAIAASSSHPRAAEADEAMRPPTGRPPTFVVHDSGIRLDARHTDPAAAPALAKLLTALDECHLHVCRSTLSVADLQCAAEAFTVERDGAVTAVSTASGLRAPAEPGPLTRWLAGRSSGRGHDVDTRPYSSLRRPRIPAAATGVRVLLIDNYDSFVFNLSQMCEELGARPEVIRNDTENLDGVLADVADGRFQRIVISPGPGRPADAGLGVALVRAVAGVVPILGVCLGHQVIGEAFNATTVRAPRPVHGQPTVVHHDFAGIYRDLSGPFMAARYHSLVIDERTLPPELRATARTPSGLLMGVRHAVFDIEGIQVHPESLLTPAGHGLLRAFLAPESTSSTDPDDAGRRR